MSFAFGPIKIQATGTVTMSQAAIDIRKIIDTVGAAWPEADRVLAARVAQDLVQLAAREQLGEQVADEIKASKAAALNIAAGAAVSGGRAITTAITSVMLAALNRIVPIPAP